MVRQARLLANPGDVRNPARKGTVPEGVSIQEDRPQRWRYSAHIQYPQGGGTFNPRPLLRVFAYDEADAKERIKQELKRRGLEEVCQRWVEDGEMVTVDVLYL